VYGKKKKFEAVVVHMVDSFFNDWLLLKIINLFFSKIIEKIMLLLKLIEFLNKINHNYTNMHKNLYNF
jgi:hypothetical protein